MTDTPDRGAAHPADPAPETLSAVFADLQALHEQVDALLAAAGHTDAGTEQLAARLAVIEQLVPQAADPAPAPSYPYRYQHLADWVDEVFTRLAAGHRAKWCTNWAAHAEAQIRLEVLWHTWEAAMAAAPDSDPQWGAVDEWLRLRLDHHAAALLDPDGPFAGCIPARGADPGRCSAPRPLAQRPLVVAPAAAVAHLDPAAQLAAHRARTRRPVGAHA